MYQLLKAGIKSIFPNAWIKVSEPYLRRVLAQFYKGKHHQCIICEANLSAFIRLQNKDLLCPSCGCLPRTRRLYQFLNQQNLLKGKILHFSPPLSLSTKLKSNTNLTYISSDFEHEFQADEQFDLTQIASPDHSFDLFIAYHVLEHITSDIKAMQELYRITRKGGKGLIQTPFKKGPIYENIAIQSPVERLQHFGQKDHVRIYSVDGLKKRLESVGFKVNLFEFEAPINNFYGFKTKETLLLVEKF